MTGFLSNGESVMPSAKPAVPKVNMRVALLLSGLCEGQPAGDGNKAITTTDWKLCYANIIETLVSPYQADVFVHTWASAGVQNMLNAYHPKDYTVESPPTFNKFFSQETTQQHSGDFQAFSKSAYSPLTYVPGRTFNQMYGMEKACFLKRKYEVQNNFKYDMVIRCRFDLKFNVPIKLEANKLSFMTWESTAPGVVDMFFAGPTKDMDTICSVYDHMYELYLDNEFSDGLKQSGFGCLHLYSSHAMLRYYLCQQGLYNSIVYPGWHWGKEIEIVRA